MARLWARSGAGVVAVGAAIVMLAAPAGSGADPHGSVTALRARNATLAERAKRATLDLYSLDSGLARARSRLAAVRTQAARVRGERDLVRREAGITRHVLVVSQHRLGDRLRTLYEEGDVDPLAVLLGSTSLDEALASLDALQRASAQSESVIRQTRSTRAQLERLEGELEARDQQLTALARQAGQAVASLEASRSDKAALISSLRTRERLNVAAIASLEATARAAEARSAALAVARATPASTPAAASEAAAEAPPSDTAPAVAGGRTIVVVATGYSIQGHTTTGVPTGWGVAAVDPSVIPLGTRFDVPGYGTAVAADTGGAVRGATVDLWFPTQAQALAWGRRTVTISVP